MRWFSLHETKIFSAALYKVMSLSRSIFFSSKHRSTEALNLVQRFGPLKRFQGRSYAKSSSESNGRSRAHPVMNMETPAAKKPASRSWSTYLIPTTALLGIAGVVALVHYNDERRVVPKGQGRSQCNTIKGPAIGGSFNLIDTENQPVTSSNFLGNWVLLYFGYTSSPDIGPDQIQLIAKAVDILESKQNLKIIPVFVTLDPQRDSPSHLRAYLREFDSRIVGLTGPVSAIKKMAQEFRVFFRKVQEDGDDYLVETSHNMYLLNPNMEVVRCFGVEYNSKHLSEAILQELKRTPRVMSPTR